VIMSFICVRFLSCVGRSETVERDHLYSMAMLPFAASPAGFLTIYSKNVVPVWWSYDFLRLCYTLVSLAPRALMTGLQKPVFSRPQERHCHMKAPIDQIVSCAVG